MSGGERSALAAFIRDQREAILTRWAAEVREQSVGRDLDEERLRDSVPILLDRVAAMAEEELGTGELATTVADLAPLHAQHRLEDGYSVDELVVDHVALRQTFQVMLAERGPLLSPVEWTILHRAIDRALVETMRFFLLAQERRLRALERLDTEIVPLDSLDDALARLVAIFGESVPAADSVMIFIADGDQLRVRASRGIDAAGETGPLSMAIGTGFAGTIALEKRPLGTRDARADDRVLPLVRERGTRALYGVPLVHEGEVIGVVHMGSLHANEFSEDDMLLLRGLASRAAAVLVHARYLERLAHEAELREQLVAVVGHDLRTPLNAIMMGASHLASMHELPAAAVRTAARMLRSSQRMRRIIEDILDFTRVRAGAMIPISPAPIRLDDVVRDVLQEIEMAHPNNPLELDVRMHVEGTWDADRLRQVLANLLTNAITHGAGSAVRVTVDREANEATITVHNGGPPIPRERIPHLFEPFHTSTPLRGGLGLGLFIARAIARAHGGDIHVTSEAAAGTCFVVRLPLA